VDRLRVLTLNIWNRQGPWEQRLPLIRRGLAELAPDLVGLQEVLHHNDAPTDQADEIADGLGLKATFGSAWHIGGGLHFGNAVLSRFPVADKQLWQLPGEDGEEIRGLLHVMVDAPCGRIPFYVTHLDWKLHQGSLRVKQVQFIAARIAETAPAGTFPAILVGDFNAEPASDEIRYLRGYHPVDGKSVYLADCFDWHAAGNPGYTFARRNPFAARAHEPDRRLDYVFVRGPDKQLRGEPLSARIVFDQPEGDIFPSDHFGVFSELQAAARMIP
jgi:endonuclease/exonuclease/phosphatase family metal-dependent hydrolase